MEIALAHRNMDFDCLASQVALTLLHPSVQIVPGHPICERIRNFLVLHRDRIPVLELAYVDWSQVKHVYLVDFSKVDRLDDRAQHCFHKYISSIGYTIFDHHPSTAASLLTNASNNSIVKQVGATTTILVELLIKKKLPISPFEATVLAAGIYEDTGCLTHTTTTDADASVISYLLKQGADLKMVMEFIRPKMDQEQMHLFEELLRSAKTIYISGKKVTICNIICPTYIEGLADITSHLLEASASEALISVAQMDDRIHLVGRSKTKLIDLRQIMQAFGGSGHATAASAVVKKETLSVVLTQLTNYLEEHAKPEAIALEIMNSPVRTITPGCSMDEAARIMLRHGQDGLVVMDNNLIVGIVSKQDVDKSRYHKLGHAPVSGFMSHPVFTVKPETTLSEIQALMVHQNIGRVPVLGANSHLLGMIGRHEMLKALHGESIEQVDTLTASSIPNIHRKEIQSYDLQNLEPNLLNLFHDIGTAATEIGMHAYLVGGCVRDLLLKQQNFDLDFVVEGSALKLADALVAAFPERFKLLAKHERFCTATLSLHSNNSEGRQDSSVAKGSGSRARSGTTGNAERTRDEVSGAYKNRIIDLATARTEYYEYPAALPTVEPSSLEQDLYRRDFTINALAMSLSPENFGHIIDFYNGLSDLKLKVIRILHPFSFIEDPTRLIRAARFASRLNFTLEQKTEFLAKRAIALGIFDDLGGVRLKEELKSILESKHRLQALRILQNCGGGLRFLDSRIKYSSKTQLHIKRAAQLLLHYPLKEEWIVYLGMLILELPSNDQQIALERLSLADEEKLWINTAAKLLVKISDLSMHSKRSTVYNFFSKYTDHCLAIACCMAPAGSIVRRLVKLYFTELKNIKTNLRGQDLVKMGFPEGPQIGKLLSELKSLKLDGKIQNTEDEKHFVQKSLNLM